MSVDQSLAVSSFYVGNVHPVSLEVVGSVVSVIPVDSYMPSIANYFGGSGGGGSVRPTTGMIYPRGQG